MPVVQGAECSQEVTAPQQTEASIRGSSFSSSKPVSEAARAWVLSEQLEPDMLPPGELRQMAKNAQRQDKVSLLLGRALGNTRATQDVFSDFTSMEDSKIGRFTPTSTSRQLHSKESISGGDPWDTRFLRRRDRMTEFVELMMVQTYVLRK